MGVFRIDSMTQVMILMMQESVDKLRAFLIQYQEECWMAMAILLTATLFLLIKRRRKIEELQRKIAELHFLDSITKKIFIRLVILSVLEDIQKMIGVYSSCEEPVASYQISYMQKALRCIDNMHRDKIFEDMDGVVACLEENYFPQNMSDGQIRDLFVYGCSILRDLKQIPLDNYRGELFFSEVLQEVVQKLPIFKMEVEKTIMNRGQGGGCED